MGLGEIFHQFPHFILQPLLRVDGLSFKEAGWVGGFHQPESPTPSGDLLPLPYKGQGG